MMPLMGVIPILFLSTLSLRRATCYSLRHSTQSRHFYPRSPCGERRQVKQAYRVKLVISIHALLAESDRQMPSIKFSPGTFLSTLSLRRATVVGTIKFAYSVLFLSTLSLRRATFAPSSTCGISTNFYPRSPCGERPGISNGALGKWEISIHALLAESDDLKKRSETHE